MATYDGNTLSGSEKFKTGDIIDFAYSGATKSLTLPKGEYLLEVWGAQGGTYSSYPGGAGGYSKGKVSLAADTTSLNVSVGGQPATNSTSGSSNVSNGGFNGGGKAKVYTYSGTTSYGQGGGGGSDIRIGSISLHARLIVAGGGAGSSSYNMLSAGAGGGTSGLSPTSGYGATQSSAGTGGSFGTGGNATGSYNYKYGAGGGGGGWYGGGASTSVSDTTTTLRASCGGGSGYVYTSSTASSYPSGCLLNSAYYLTEAQTIAGNASMPSVSGGTQTGQTGHGHVRIIVVKIQGDLELNFKVFDSWKTSNEAFIKVNGVWKEVQAIGTKISGEWKGVS